MMKKKFLCIGITALVMSTCIAGCGSADKSSMMTENAVAIPVIIVEVVIFMSTKKALQPMIPKRLLRKISVVMSIRKFPRLQKVTLLIVKRQTAVN